MLTVRLVRVTFGFGLIFFDDPFKPTVSCSPFGGTNESRSSGEETVPAVVEVAVGMAQLRLHGKEENVIREKGEGCKRRLM